MNKRIIPCIYVDNGKAVANSEDLTVISENVPEFAMDYCNRGADALLYFDLSDSDYDHEKAIHLLITACEQVQIPIIAGGNVMRLEDVKKILYAGAQKAIIDMSKQGALELLEDAAARFGKERIAVAIYDFDTLFKNKAAIAAWSSEIIYMHTIDFNSVESVSDLPGIVVTRAERMETIFTILSSDTVSGLAGRFVSDGKTDLVAFKHNCMEQGISMQVLESAVSFSEFKTDERGLIPVVTQDYKTGEVLMVAYMNAESFQKTLETGKMVYFSRSRKELWMKGETSGHFQYVKSMAVDCDKDTLLAKVAQIGAACHTGNSTCFYTPLFGNEYDEKNPLLILENVMKTILDRKEHPKDGSYTNYLFDKGIDKILKKVGEEASEIIIAAKNPDQEEVKYEMSDFLYHMMVLMAERGISWDDITTELARR